MNRLKRSHQFDLKELHQTGLRNPEHLQQLHQVVLGNLVFENRFDLAENFQKHLAGVQNHQGPQIWLHLRHKNHLILNIH